MSPSWQDYQVRHNCAEVITDTDQTVRSCHYIGVRLTRVDSVQGCLGHLVLAIHVCRNVQENERPEAGKYVSLP